MLVLQMANVSVYGAGASAIHQYAAAFAQYTEDTPVGDIETLFRRLGKIGSGLNALLQKSPAMGKLFGVINNLSMTTSMAAVNKASCNKICALGFDVLVVLDAAGAMADSSTTHSLQQPANVQSLL
eukprot:GHUV01049960.1.p1 GENE.GHUV01049960.1~~GHUV01049960.1.p1  ORF type:complete len:126 (+),score=44.98 GHUV01049960.1:883-1260(+)